jgi:hypothetical protein
MTFDRGRLLALALGSGFLVELTATYLGEDAGLLAGAFEATQGDFERLVLFYTNARHAGVLKDFLR